MSKASEYQSEYQRRYPEKRAAILRRYYARHRVEILAKAKLRDPAKVRARSVANLAIRSGQIKRGTCEVGDGSCLGSVQAHHDDYSKPLEVRWFCRSHHQRMHRAERDY